MRPGRPPVPKSTVFQSNQRGQSGHPVNEVYHKPAIATAPAMQAASPAPPPTTRCPAAIGTVDEGVGTPTVDDEGRTVGTGMRMVEVPLPEG